MSLYILLVRIIHDLCRPLFQFIWKGLFSSHKYHLASWSALSRPKKGGGWGIKDLKHFNLSLCAKSMWRAINHSDLWGSLLKSKYMSKLLVDIWLRRGIFNSENSWLIWRSLLSTLHIIIPEISWQVGHGTFIYIGRDPILGMQNFSLSQPLLAKLSDMKLLYLIQVHVPGFDIFPLWWSTSELGLMRGFGNWMGQLYQFP